MKKIQVEFVKKIFKSQKFRLNQQDLRGLHMCSEYFFLRLKFIALVPIYFKIDLEYILQNKYS